MIIVRIVGGLGNQMYGYALYRTLLARGRNAKMDLRFWDHQDSPVIDKRKYLLSEVFNIEERRVSRTEFFCARVERKLGLMKNYVDKETGFQPEMLDIKHGFLYGYWQSFKYFAEIEDTIRKEFTFKKPLTGKSSEVIDEIRSCNSVSLSIRRGDYVKLGHVLPEEYYRNAIRYIQERVPDAKFFCISDDIEFCKNTYGGVGIKFVECATKDDPIFDMQVITSCKHNILANSTFSIWAAWLNPNPNRIVIRPEKYTPNPSTPNINRDLYPEGWIAIPSFKTSNEEIK